MGYGLNGAEIVFNPSATVGALRCAHKGGVCGGVYVCRVCVCVCVCVCVYVCLCVCVSRACVVWYVVCYMCGDEGEPY